MKFDSPDQERPTFEAKGIETIRKDQCALTQKILRDSLIEVFKGGGVDNLKEYLFRQWALIHSGRFPVSDFILTGRVRSQYRAKVGPVQAALAKRLAEAAELCVIKNVYHTSLLHHQVVTSNFAIVCSPPTNFLHNGTHILFIRSITPRNI
jgi:DNA polymerase elongation subunit (family B)